MTIKRRLFISNMLMLVIPILLSTVLVGGIIFAFTEITRSHEGSSFEGKEGMFDDSIGKVNDIFDKRNQNFNLDMLKNEVNFFNEKHKNVKISLSIYKEKELVYPTEPFVNGPDLDMILSQEGNHLSVIDNIALYRKDVGEYSLILSDTNFVFFNKEAHKTYSDSIINLGIMMIIIIIVIILLTNRFLTKVMFKSIITPLDTLAYGVHQIRDGNLNYHIQYDRKDEFTEVCSDFNEMAQRLLDSVNARKKDEVNRKELIAGISHDLRTPLTSIKAYVEGIETGVASTPEIQKRYLNTIKNKTNDLEHIVNQLFLFSKLDIGEFPFYLEKVDIGKELSNMISNIFEEYEKKGLTIILAKNLKEVFVEVDIVQLRDAIINILENSVKYKNKKQGEMKIVCEVYDKKATITLSDNGPGVVNEAMEKLFDVFYRCDPSRSNPSKGSGLGLSITAKILELLGGSIRAENIVEGGLAIIMTLPVYSRGCSSEKNSDH